METRKLIPRFTFGRVVVGLAVVAVIGSGTAYAANEWTGANIVDGSLTGADLANNSIGSLKIIDGAVSSADIANNSVASGDILDSTITSSDIKNNSVSTVDVLNGSLTGADVADESLGDADIAPLNGDAAIIDNTITTFDIATDAIDSDEVLDFGLSNQDVGVLYAVVNADGTVAQDSGGVTVTKLAGFTGDYEVDFGLDVSNCAFTATIGPASAGSALGEVNVADRVSNANAVFVDTNNSDGSAADLPFHLVVVC